MTILLPNLAISGYRSFGKELQYFDSFSKINVLIGRNNSGKSNVLRAMKEVFSQVNARGEIRLEPNAQHLPDSPPFQIGIGEAFTLNSDGHAALVPQSPRNKPVNQQANSHIYAQLAAKLLSGKAKFDNTNLAWSLTTIPDRKHTHDTWVKALASMSDDDVYQLWTQMTGNTRGNRQLHWQPGIVELFPKKIESLSIELIPAIRRIGASGTDPTSYDGTGIIDRLAQLQNPSADKQDEKHRFEAVNEFLREVTDRPEARIEIPYARDTILVHMDNKVLPIECLGSGLHEVIILAAAVTTLSEQIVCIEEPELHLNPILQKKFIRHLSTRTDNQYFITTHSAAIMDTPDAEVYHVTLIGGASKVSRVTSDSAKVAVCEDLGYHPSDLLLANCVVWVEGPSDRLYLNWWLNALDSSLVEGIHFSVMFYGGKLAAHISNEESSAVVSEFIQLRRLNQRGAILIDSDKANAHTRFNQTKKRLRDEFDKGPGFAWITDGREVENYLPIASINQAVAATIPSAIRIGGADRFDNLLKIRRASGTEDQASKVEVAKWITTNTSPVLNALDLQQQLTKLRAFILASNPVGGGAN